MIICTSTSSLIHLIVLVVFNRSCMFLSRHFAKYDIFSCLSLFRDETIMICEVVDKLIIEVIIRRTGIFEVLRKRVFESLVYRLLPRSAWFHKRQSSI